MLLCSILTIGCDTTKKEGAYSGPNKKNRTQISGTIKNSEKENIRLRYVPLYRGNINFDGFTSVDSHIDPEGHFTIDYDNLTDAANYNLDYENKGGLELVLFTDDEIKLDFDMDDPKSSLYARGKGAGKINTFNLAQFTDDNFILPTDYSLDEYNNHIVDIISGQRDLLDAIYLKNPDTNIIANSENVDKIHRIIRDSPLTEKEYKFLLNVIDFSKHSLLIESLSLMGRRKELDTVQIDFKNKALNYVNEKELKRLDNINGWRLSRNLLDILKIEYLRYLKDSKNSNITYGNFNSFFRGSEYMNWIPKYLKANFNQEIYNKYFADITAWSMTLGGDYESNYKRIDTLAQNNKYTSRLGCIPKIVEFRTR